MALYTDLATANREIDNLQTQLQQEYDRQKNLWKESTITTIDIVTAIVIFTVGIGIAGGYLYYLCGWRMWDIGLHNAFLAAVAIIVSLFLTTAGVTVTRMTNGYWGEWLSSGMIIVGVTTYMLAIGFLPEIVAGESVLPNPTVTVDRAPMDWDEVKIEHMDVPVDSGGNATFETARVVVQIETTLTADDAMKVSDKKPFVVQVPKGSKGKVFFDPKSKVGDKPLSLSSSF